MKKQNKILNYAKIFFILIITFPISLSWATNYYIDATSGNDSNNGLSPSTAWKTIAKVNNSSFMPSDSVLFKRGEMWREQLRISSNGSSAARITYGAYGQGDEPIIDGGNSRECINAISRDNIVIQNLHLRKGNSFCINLWECDNWIIENNHVEYANVTNIFCYGINIQIRQNEINNSVVQHGIYFGNLSKDGIVEYNYIHDNNVSGVQFNNDASTRQSGMKVRYNKLENNQWVSINDLATEGGQFYYNLIYGITNYGRGIILGSDGVGTNSRNTIIYNNTVHGDFVTDIEIESNSIGHKIYNNIISNSNYYSNRSLLQIASGGSAELDYNCYYMPKFSRTFSYHNAQYNSLESWQSATNQDNHSIDQNPKFIDISKNDFEIQKDSPCIDAGIDVKLTYDFYHNEVPDGKSVDIGAYEFINESITPPKILLVKLIY